MFWSLVVQAFSGTNDSVIAEKSTIDQVMCHIQGRVNVSPEQKNLLDGTKNTASARSSW